MDLGTIRIKAKNLKSYILTASGWKVTFREFPDIIHAVKLFKAHDKLDLLIDEKDPKWIKGMLSPEGLCKGARINVLPDGQKIDKAYSLFAKYLTFHDENSHDHWDVIYQNPGGTYAYCYDLNKIQEHVKKKYQLVDEFDNYYPKLKESVKKALNEKKDNLALSIFTLLKTYMRVGNETYFKANGHKGLTTLKKKDITITGNEVTFEYLGKDGVPRNISEEFPESYINFLNHVLKKKTQEDFIFTNKHGKPFTDMAIKEAIQKYCGTAFYPHIVRSHYATKRAKEFLIINNNPTKDEVKALYTEIANKLGHRKFSKKDKTWKENTNITIHYYINPEIVEKIEKRIKS